MGGGLKLHIQSEIILYSFTMSHSLVTILGSAHCFSGKQRVPQSHCWCRPPASLFGAKQGRADSSSGSLGCISPIGLPALAMLFPREGADPACPTVSSPRPLLPMPLRPFSSLLLLGVILLREGSSTAISLSLLAQHLLQGGSPFPGLPFSYQFLCCFSGSLDKIWRINYTSLVFSS